MKTAAIICEYNPFHNGHLYQIDRIKSDLSVDAVICIMSGDFTQRGEPAVFDRHTRAGFALENGADLVISLPAFASLGAADLFSYTGVSLLNRLNTVDYLCFGAECDDLSLLTDIAKETGSSSLLRSDEFRSLIKEGKTFARARAVMFPEYSEILDKPNNILAIGYLNALDTLGSSIKPYLIKRIGDDHNGISVKPGKYSSALSIRNSIKNNEICDLTDCMPPAEYETVKSLTPVFADDFSSLLKYKLLSCDDLSDYLDVNGDLSNRILNNVNGFKDMCSFAANIKSKNTTHSGIMRALFHILLDIKGTSDQRKDVADSLNALRLLGFKRSASELMDTLNERSDIKLITNVARSEKEFNKITTDIFNEDKYASDVYHTVLAEKSGNLPVNDLSKPVVIV